jgi:hypothetical protein
LLVRYLSLLIAFAVAVWLPRSLLADDDGDPTGDADGPSEVEAAPADPLAADLAGPPTAAAWPGVPVGYTLTFYRGDECAPAQRIRFVPRWVRTCKSDARVSIQAAGAAPARVQTLPNVPSRLVQMPTELARQWRTCPYKPIPAFEVPGSPLVPYEDPQIGRCYLWRPLDVAAWQRIAAQVHGDRLQGAHPYLASVLRELAVRGAAQGIELYVLRSVAAMAIHRDKGGHSGKHKGKKHKVNTKHYHHAGGRYAFMHPWGQAIDLTLGWKRPAMAPDAHYRPGSAVWRGFRSLGAWADEMGVVWLGAHMRGELGHFEWHPTTWGTIDGADLSRRLALYRQGGVEKAQEALRYSPETPSPFNALRDVGPWP